MCVVACIVYGIVHDQITARICVEYFTIGHPPVFATHNPTLLGFGWGIIATWWVGVLIGVPLACACRVGRWPKREPWSIVRPLFCLMGCSFTLAIVAGVAGCVVGRNGWVVLAGPLANLVPRERHIPFLIDLWAHNASYFAGFVGGTILIVATLVDRQRQSTISTVTT